MRVIGIVAEYNPFHRGHEYLIAKAREMVHDPRAIVMPVISGPFTQRGTPAVLPAQVRARQALRCGANVVLELPFTFACAPSSRFAYGAVSTLLATGVVTDIAFGVDTDDTDALRKLSAEDFENNPRYAAVLRAGLSDGLSFAAARASAICSDYGEEYKNLLSAPNSILALEYLTALHKLDSSGRINVIMIKRAGDPYSASSIPSDSSFASATAIRRQMIKTLAPEYRCSAAATALCGLLPDKSLAVMLAAMSSDEYRTPDLGAYFRDCLLRLSAINQGGFNADSYAYMGDGLAGYLSNFTEALRPGDLPADDYGAEVFEKTVATRHFTLTRIERALTSLAAGQSAEMLCAKDASYIRVLGFDREGRYCLKIMRRNAALPIISNPSDALELYSSSPVLKSMFSLDMRAASLYWEMSGKDFLHEWELPPVML